MAKRAAARWFCCRMRPICRFTAAGSSGFFERAMRAARRSSAARCAAELVVHRLLFAAPVGGAAQDHGLVGLGMAGELDLDAFAHRAPAIRDEQARRRTSSAPTSARR